MQFLKNCLLGSLGFLFFAGTLSAQFKLEEHAQLELIAEKSAIVPGESFNLAVQFEIDPHWHIYWRNPGSSGLPPEITWNLPDGFVVGDIGWPAPKRIELGGLVNYGYEDSVVLVVPVQAPESLNIGDKVKILAEVSYLICEEVCLPGDASLELTLPVGASGGQTDQAEAFEVAGASLPYDSIPWVVNSSVQDDRLVLGIESFSGEEIPDEMYFYSNFEGLTDPDAAQVLSLVGQSSARLEIPLAQDFDRDQFETAEGVLQSDGMNWELSSLIKDRAAKEPATTTNRVVTDSGGFEGALLSLGLPGWLALAFLGGLILNVMPCVLPVLSLKVFSLLKHNGQSRGESVLHGGAYSLGVISSFLVLAGVLLGLRAVGEQVGWGFQLQSPGFVVLLSTVFFLFGLNLMGVFEIGSSLVGADTGVAQRSDLAGSFGMGVLAAVVGAPCMGPMVASVSGIAIQADAVTGLLIFAVMGAGLASPFMLLAVFPKLVAYLPKPGLWMESVKQFMGFLLMAAVVFLLWVAGGQGGADAIIVIAVVLLLVGLAAWIYGRWGAPVRSRKSQWTARIVTAALVLFSAVYGLEKAELAFESYQNSEKVVDESGQWGPWSREKVSRELANDHPVFVDFTASWCLICQANKKVALRTKATESLFEDYGVVALEADWTRRDAAITEELEAFGRAGVPLYVLYHPNGETTVFPQSLTNGIVREVLENSLN